MKTFKNHFSKIIAFENLLNAFYKAARSKRERIYVMAFAEDLETNLFILQEELREQTYLPGGYATFRIYEPKPRMISAAPFRDRVVHHALINIISPLLEKSFVYDSYANRVGKGTHKAIRRYQSFLRQYGFVLKNDIKKYFPSIDHEILKALLHKKIADPQTRWLIDIIIDGSNPQEEVIEYFPGDDLFTPFGRRKGLPIGNLTSQFFANFYLNPFDHFVKETLRCPGYVRYVDDFVLFDNSKNRLKEWERDIERFLLTLRLKLNPRRRQIYPSSMANRFLGQVIYQTHRRLAGENVRRFKKRLKQWEKEPPGNLKQRIGSWKGHAMQANSQGLVNALGKTFLLVFIQISNKLSIKRVKKWQIPLK